MITVRNYKTLTQEIIDGTLSSYITIELKNLLIEEIETFSYGGVCGCAGSSRTT